MGWYHQCRKRARGDPKNDNGMGCDIYPGSRSSTQNQLFLKTCFKVFCCEDLHNSTSRLHIFVYLKRNLPLSGNVLIKSEIEGLHQWGIRGEQGHCSLVRCPLLPHQGAMMCIVWMFRVRITEKLSCSNISYLSRYWLNLVRSS